MVLLICLVGSSNIDYSNINYQTGIVDYVLDTNQTGFNLSADTISVTNGSTVWTISVNVNGTLVFEVS